jgi:hypothetical protein
LKFRLLLMRFESHARLIWTTFEARICSHEHEITFTPFLGAPIEEANRQA